jgi:hypothetical protein
MGGLVARAACLSVDVVQKVRGVVHTVQPSNGSVTAFRRFHTGCMSPFDSGVKSGTIESITDGMFQKIAGSTPEQYATLLSGMPGLMELLPNHRYGLGTVNQWLVTNQPTDLSKIYDTYKQSRRPGIVLPSLVQFHTSIGHGLNGALVQAALVALIEAARVFHETLADNAHPNTFVLFGSGLKTDESVEFKNSAVNVIQKPAGDGTVHQASGSCPGIRAGFHQGSSPSAGPRTCGCFFVTGLQSTSTRIRKPNSVRPSLKVDQPVCWYGRPLSPAHDPWWSVSGESILQVHHNR